MSAFREVVVVLGIALALGLIWCFTWGRSGFAIHPQGTGWQIEWSIGVQETPGSEPQVEVPEDPAPVERPLTESFTGVVVSGAVDVSILDSPRNKVVIHPTTRVKDLSLPRVVDGELLIQGAAMDYDGADLPSVTVYHRGIVRVVHRGKGDLWAMHLAGTRLSATTTAEANLYVGGEGGDIRLVNGGSGDIIANWLQVGRLDIALTGSGDVEPTGDWGRIEVDMAGSGDLRADGVRPAEVRIRLVGDSSADVGPASVLDATIEGDGKISASGHPEPVRQHVTGKGTVEVTP